MHAQLQNFSIVLIVKNVCTFNNEQSFPDSAVYFFSLNFGNILWTSTTITLCMKSLM